MSAEQLREFPPAVWVLSPQLNASGAERILIERLHAHLLELLCEAGALPSEPIGVGAAGSRPRDDEGSCHLWVLKAEVQGRAPAH